MLNKCAEDLSGYRQVLYANYRATQFGALNSGCYLNRIPEFLADYEGLLPAHPAAKVLDVGCGMGHFLHFLRERGYWNCVGIDVSPDQIAFCRAHGLENVELVGDLFQYLEAHANSFDLVVMNDVIEHFNKDEIIRLLLLVKRTLKPHGRLVVRTPNIACTYGPYARYIDFTHEIVFSEQSLKQVLLAAEFQDVMVRGSRLAVTLRPRRLLFLLARRIWFMILKVIYTIEVGTDRPTIYTKNLIASGTTGGLLRRGMQG